MISELQASLGQRLVAYSVGVRSPKLVGRWVTGDDVPTSDQERRIGHLYEVVQALRKEADETIRALLMGAWPELDDRSPVEMLHEDRGERMAEIALDWAQQQ